MITIYTLLALFALCMQAFFTSTEMAFTSVNRIKLKGLIASGDPHARRLMDFLNKEGMFLGTTLVGTNICVVTAATLATRVFSEYFGGIVPEILTTVILVPITLIFAEIVPKMISRQFSTPYALKAVFPLNAFFKLFYPIIISVNFAARLLLRPFGGRKAPWDVTFTKGDLKRIIHAGGETGDVEEGEVELIHKVLDLEAKHAESIMVPLYRVSSISADESADNLKQLVAMTGFSRIPVYRNSKNEITGIANIYDVLFSEEGEKGKKVEYFEREPVSVRKTDGLDIVLARLRHKRQPMGIVVDEHNSAIGIITIEDILEEIVGEIEDMG